MAIPTLLDTDIGTDIDDAYALVFALNSPELELRAITTVNNDVTLRAKIAIELLRCMGRTDIPVAAGESAALTPGVNRGWLGNEGIGIDLSGVFVERDIDLRPAARVIAEEAYRAAESGEPLTLVTIGALTNAAHAFRQFPREMSALRRIVAMASCFGGHGEENARGEHNVACDPVALQVVLNSGVPVDLIGLNVTQQTAMSDQDLLRMEAMGGPLAEALSGMHRAWFRHILRDSSPMHDSLAVAAVFDSSVVRMEPVTARVLDGGAQPGAVEFNPPRDGEVTQVRVATDIDADAFHRLFFARVESAIQNSTNSR
jgi:purine nucleosidase